MEMNRILKKGGLLLTSTDYWLENITNTKHVLSREAPDKVFDRNEIEDAIAIGEKSGLKLIAPIDYICMDKVVHWGHACLLSLIWSYFAILRCPDYL